MPAPLRIAQVVEAVEGGCKQHVLDLVCGLDPDRLAQTVVFSPHRDPGFAEQVRDGGRVEAIECPALRREIRPWADFAAHRFLKDLFRERDFDIIHCHSAKAGFLGRFAARGLRAARLYTPHCFAFEMRVSAIRRAAYIAAERWAGRHTDRLIAVAPSEAEIARARGVAPPDRIVTIENAIDPARLDVRVDVSEKRAELGIEADGRVVLSVGALRPQKGYETLVRAVPAVLGDHPGAVFVLAGEGWLRGELERLVEELGIGEAVRLPGTRDDVPELLQAADSFVMPSLWEAGPYALLEAMAAGAPVVGSDIAGIRDWARPGETGRLAKPVDPGELAREISAALSDPTESRRMADAAREMVLGRNTLDRWLRSMARLYDVAASVL